MIDCNGRCCNEWAFGQGFDSPQLHRLYHCPYSFLYGHGISLLENIGLDDVFYVHRDLFLYKYHF